MVRQVQEFYGDYHCVNEDLFTLNLQGSLGLSHGRAALTPMEEHSFNRTCQGIIACLLSLKVRPHIRCVGHIRWPGVDRRGQAGALLCVVCVA